MFLNFVRLLIKFLIILFLQRLQSMQFNWFIVRWIIGVGLRNNCTFGEATRSMPQKVPKPITRSSKPIFSEAVFL